MRMRLGVVAVVAAGTLLVAVACSETLQSQETRGVSSAMSQSSGQAGDESVVATIDGRALTLSDVDAKVLTANRDVFQALYDARYEALEALVAEMLLDQRAEKEGLSREELVNREITSKITDVTDADVEKFFEENRARLGGQTLEQIGGQVREYLESQQAATQTRMFLDSLRADADISIDLEPPRVNVTVARGERIVGPEDAEVTIVEYSDFQ